MELKLFGNSLKKYRLEKKISQEKLAEYAGLHRTYVSDIERGVRNITLRSLLRLSVALQTTPSNLLKCFDEVDLRNFLKSDEKSIY